MNTFFAHYLEPKGAPPNNSHPSEEILALFIEGGLLGNERQAVIGHVLKCALCYEVVQETLGHLEAAQLARPFLLYPRMTEACDGLRMFWKDPASPDQFFSTHREAQAYRTSPGVSYAEVVACEEGPGIAVGFSVEFLRTIQHAGQQMREALLKALNTLVKYPHEPRSEETAPPQDKLSHFETDELSIAYEVDPISPCLLLHTVTPKTDG